MAEIIVNTADNLPGDYNFPDHYMNDGLLEFTVTLTEEDGTPIDITGASVKMQLSTSNTTSPPNPAFEFSTDVIGDGLITLSQAAQGVITFEQINSFTIPAGKYYYDLQVTDASGFIKTYLKGTWNVIRDITR